ncbi:hypothetical protein GBF38_017221 [Nibea albiflora]|uniref:Uncharacterized protein n=1 Tax=Nibea albiflora TaxID=240163 RepID=A0ACB7EFY9_NIBAL|nr:hypothetical protein GBF38_017221 [Nibea albiflora]
METVNREKINYFACVLFNGPILILTFMANFFFIFCMVRPLHGERIKQPLKLLLASLICSTMIYLMASFVLSSYGIQPENNKTAEISLLVVTSSLTASMASSVWLNFFFYTQIVPAQRALFIWIKKNIKPIIYCGWLLERIYSFFEVTLWILERSNCHDNYNLTMDRDTHENDECLENLNTLLSVDSFRFSVCLYVVLMSSGSTVVYLCRHMRRMMANGPPLSCPMFRNQVRVTATGILQVILYIICATWNIYKSFTSTSVSPCIHYTVFNLYMAGTTLNLGAGQGVIRKRVVDIWLKATQWCKAPKTQSEQGG